MKARYTVLLACTTAMLCTSKGRESHVYEKTAGGWRIAHLHYSGLSPQSPQ